MILPINCKCCDSENLEIRKGAGPHTAALICADCDLWQQWLSKSIVRSLGIDLPELSTEVES